MRELSAVEDQHLLLFVCAQEFQRPSVFAVMFGVISLLYATVGQAGKKPNAALGQTEKNSM
jgi:hypothetical protein